MTAKPAVPAEPAVTDVLSGGGSHLQERRPAGRTAARLLAVALLVLLGVADAQARRLEVDALVERAREGQATVAFADRRLAATVQYASPQLTSPTAPLAVRADLQALVRREAAASRATRASRCQTYAARARRTDRCQGATGVRATASRRPCNPPT